MDDVDVRVISDDELTCLALAADPDTNVAADAVPFWEVVGEGSPSLLPGWYMPARLSAGFSEVSRTKRIIVLALVLGFLTVDALGLCNTYGALTLG
jgi:hypothetical protein